MNYNILLKSKLFQGITQEEVKSMLKCLHAYTKTYQAEELIYRVGDKVDCMGFVLNGGVIIESNDIWGNKTILGHAAPGEVFAEVYACANLEPLMVNVSAICKTEILFLNIEQIITTCPNSCVHHNRLIRNLLSVTAQKNLNLTHKIFHTAPKTIRGKLLSYLSYQSILQGKYQFEIPFDRQQLADYLAVDRSALSNELSKMQKDGILTFKKNHFSLLEILDDSSI